MGIDGPFTQNQPLGHLPVGEAGRKQAQDLGLPKGQPLNSGALSQPPYAPAGVCVLAAMGVDCAREKIVTQLLICTSLL